MNTIRILPAILLFAAAVCFADNEVVGTIEFVLDGEEQTWYVVQPTGDMLPNALWLAMGPERGAVSITAYRNADIELVRHEASGSAIPDGDAEALVMSLGFPLGSTDQVYSLPVESGSGPAVIMLLKNWSDPLDAYTLGDGPGEIHLSKIDVSQDSLSSISGTFDGIMQHSSDGTRIIENGRFDIEHVIFIERP